MEIFEWFSQKYYPFFAELLALYIRMNEASTILVGTHTTNSRLIVYKKLPITIIM